MMLHCHCRDCQRSSGGPFSSFVVVPTEAFKLSQGSLRFHDSPSHASGKTHRGFCPECGSPILGLEPSHCRDQNWRTLMIRAGSTRKVDVRTSDAHPWDEMNPALRKFEKYPS